MTKQTDFRQVQNGYVFQSPRKITDSSASLARRHYPVIFPRSSGVLAEEKHWLINPYYILPQLLPQR